MVNEHLRGDMATMLAGLGEQMRGIAEVQRRRALLTATATACEGRIEVTVNADGLLVDTRFAEDIRDLTMDEVAENVTRAVQEAAQKVNSAAGELMNPLLAHRNALPALSEIVEGVPDLDGLIPQAPPTPTVSPRSPDWPGSAPEEPDDAGSPSVVADRD